MGDLAASVIAMKQAGASWGDVAAAFPDVNRETLRGKYRRWKAKQEPPTCIATGIRADEGLDEEEIYRRACAKWKRTEKLIERRASQSLVFSHGPVCMVWFADAHLGGDGVDYPRFTREAQIVADTPGMYAGFVGDIVDNFIIQQLAYVQMNASFTIPEQWALARRQLRLLVGKLKLAVSGNHDWWTKRMAGIDYFKDVIAGISPDVLYDTDDCELMIKVGAAEFPTRIRHKWRGSSIYNPSHGIERAAKWDQNFVLGIGAHFHECGVARGFNVGGRQGLAVMCGCYKRDDNFARRVGFPKQNNSTAIAVVFDDETNSMTGFDNLEFAAQFMRGVYQRGG